MVDVPLGTEDSIKRLFSYPPSEAIALSGKQQLTETVKHYIDSSLKRDSYPASASVQSKNGQIVAQFSDPASQAAYAKVLPAFLAAGNTGYQNSVKVSAQWQYNWRFFLPLGLPMVNHLTVQLMHYPPDYVLERDQDYLGAKTTEHWGRLLEENGAAAKDLDRYQAIVDMAPIAAPALDGSLVQPVAIQYGDYVKQLLKVLLPDGNRPMVAFGGIVHTWVEQQNVHFSNVMYGTAQDGSVRDNFHCGTLEIAAGRSVKMLEANHPSRILAQRNHLKANPSNPDAGLGSLIWIMHDDLIAARWQVEMAKNAASLDPGTVLQKCKDYWDAPENHQKIADLVHEIVLKPHAAAEGLPEPAPMKAEVLEQVLDPKSDLSKKSKDLIAEVSNKRRAESELRRQMEENLKKAQSAGN
jgi:hypothetical protein